MVYRLCYIVFNPSFAINLLTLDRALDLGGLYCILAVISAARLHESLAKLRGVLIGICFRNCHSCISAPTYGIFICFA